MTDDKKLIMMNEAKERLKLLQLSEECVQALDDGTFRYIEIDFDNMSMYVKAVPDNVQNIARRLEDDHNILVYYCIKDIGYWPDGYTFDRYTFVYVGEEEYEYEYVKDDCIGACHTLPAYVVNMENQDCSEFCEFAYRVVNDELINIS